MKADSPLLQLDGLSLTYRTEEGDLPAVRDVDLVVRAGEVVGVAGESGCGKSSLANAVLRLQPDNAKVTGRVLVEGHDVVSMRWADLRTLRWAGASIVFQGALHSLNPVHRVGDQLAEPIRIHEPEIGEAEIERRVADLLEEVGLPAQRARTYPHQLSGGQRQRVMIAMALACRPRLVIADEPTTALDVMVQAQVLRVLTQLVAQRDVGMMLISHDLSVLGSVCDRVVVMYAGRVIEQGGATEVFDDARHPYTAALSAAFPRIGDEAARYAPSGLPGDPPDLRQLPDGCPFVPRCPMAIDPCSDAEPPLLDLGGGRTSACIRAKELG